MLFLFAFHVVHFVDIQSTLVCPFLGAFNISPHSIYQIKGGSRSRWVAVMEMAAATYDSKVIL